MPGPDPRRRRKQPIRPARSALEHAPAPWGVLGPDGHEAFLREVETALPVVLWELDLQSERILYVSSGYERIWGRPLGAVREDPRSWMDAIVPASRGRVEAAFQRLLLQSEPYDQEFAITLPDGTQRWIRDRGAAVADAAGRPTRAVGIAVDVTEEKRIRERLRAATLAAARAEDRERTLLAGDLHDSVGQLLPLARIKLAALLDGQACPGREEKLEAAVREIGSILAQAEEQIRTLTFRLSPVPFPEIGFAAAVEYVAEVMSDRYGLAVCVRDDGVEKPLDGDRAAVLIRGARELLINVARHAKTDRAEVWIACEGESVVVAVEDRGVGFDPTAGRAWGFGLMSTRDRVEGAGGRMAVEAEPGRGTRIRLVMPASRSPSR